MDADGVVLGGHKKFLSRWMMFDRGVVASPLDFLAIMAESGYGLVCSGYVCRAVPARDSEAANHPTACDIVGGEGDRVPVAIEIERSP